MPAMRAWVVRKLGLPSTSPHFNLEPDYPAPEATGNLLLIKVTAVGINIGSGAKPMYAIPIKFLQQLPGVPESEFSGEIAGGKLDGTGFALGDEVFGLLPFPGHISSGVGALAEYTVVPGDLVLRKPETLSHAEAASTTMGLTLSYWSLIKEGGINSGANRRVFINGGSEGMGQAAIQVAKAYGAHVVATGSPSSALLSSLGADEVIDYRSVDLIPYLISNNSGANAFDVIYDTIGNPKLYRMCPAFLQSSGFYADIAAPDGSFGGFVRFFLKMIHTTLPRVLGGTPRKYAFVTVPQGRWGTVFAEASELLAAGKFKSTVDSEFKMEDAKKAYERVLSGRAKGKVVINVA